MGIYAQDEVVKLKGHESLTKLLMWYSENEPKADEPGQIPNKTSLEARITTHLKTACTIANVLGHAILSEPSVSSHFFPHLPPSLCMAEWRDDAVGYRAGGHRQELRNDMAGPV
jgi:hypothetical protein